EIEALAGAGVAGSIVDRVPTVRGNQVPRVAARQRRNSRDLNPPPIEEPSLFVDGIAALVHRAMVAAAEQDEVVERRRAAVSPMLHMVRVDEAAILATGEAAAA